MHTVTGHACLHRARTNISEAAVSGRRAVTLYSFCTSDPADRHSRNSLSKFGIESAGHFCTKAFILDLHENFVYVMINVGPAGQPGDFVRRGKNINVAIFSDTINVINVKLCLILPLIELYLFIPFRLS